jgi:hypothetical protein
MQPSRPSPPGGDVLTNTVAFEGVPDRWKPASAGTEGSLSSHRSSASVQRREDLERRRALRAQEEERIRQDEEQEIEAQDEASLVGTGIAGGVPLTEAALFANSQPSIQELRARIEHLALEQKMLTDQLATQDLKPSIPLGAPPSRVSFPHEFFPRGITGGSGFAVATVSQKVRPDKPKPWKGSFDQGVRDGWIRSLKGYLAGLGIALDARIDESLAPLPFNLLRACFDADTPSTGVSPQQWFDSCNLRAPWTTASEVIRAVESFWVDDHAKVRSITAFRAARQGPLRAREFGALVEQLAVACHARSLTDEARKEVFLFGLQPSVKVPVDLFVRQEERRQGVILSFDAVVNIAADYDGVAHVMPPVSSRKEGRSTSAPSPLTSTTHTGSTPVKVTPPRQDWVTQATEWQSTHPVADKATWLRSNGRKSAHPIQCFNCGKRGDVYSISCQDPRVVPSKAPLYVAGILKLAPAIPVPPSVPSIPSSAGSEQGKDNDE